MAQSLTVKVQHRELSDGEKKHFVKIDLGAGTYDTGVVLTPAALGFSRYIRELVLADNIIGGFLWRYDHANNTLKSYEFDYPNAAEGPALERDADDNPGAVTLYGIAFGY